MSEHVQCSIFIMTTIGVTGATGIIMTTIGITGMLTTMAGTIMTMTAGGITGIMMILIWLVLPCNKSTKLTKFIISLFRLNSLNPLSRNSTSSLKSIYRSFNLLTLKIMDLKVNLNLTDLSDSSIINK